MILSVEKLSHSYGVRTLFKDVTFNIEMGDKIGIIGVNGTEISNVLAYEVKQDSDHWGAHVRLDFIADGDVDLDISQTASPQ